MRSHLACPGQQRLHALRQAPPEDRVGKIGLRLFHRGDSVKLGGGAWAEAGELRKDEPHRVAPLRSGAKLVEGGVKYSVLGFEKAIQFERVGGVHAGMMRSRPPAGKGGSDWRLLLRRQPSRQQVKT